MGETVGGEECVWENSEGGRRHIYTHVQTRRANATCERDVRGRGRPYRSQITSRRSSRIDRSATYICSLVLAVVRTPTPRASCITVTFLIRASSTYLFVFCLVGVKNCEGRSSFASLLVHPRRWNKLGGGPSLHRPYFKRSKSPGVVRGFEAEIRLDGQHGAGAVQLGGPPERGHVLDEQIALRLPCPKRLRIEANDLNETPPK